MFIFTFNYLLAAYVCVISGKI